tara:strand:+ start:65 stop:1153 length:1089 start_codon:yes stop_codon:yes gene_type:complete
MPLPVAFCLGFILLGQIFFGQVYSQDNALGLESRFEGIFSEKSNSVVRVKASRVAKAGDKIKRFLKMGSGFFVSKEGHVLTTGLLPNADRVWIEYNDSYLLAEEVGHDPMCNLSLLKLLEPPNNISYVRVNDYSDKIDPGSFLLGITFALEFEVGPTFGLMQSYEYSFGKRLFPTRMIRSSLALGPGEVGAPVFDLNGRFVGITHAALPDLQSSFLLPAKACKRIRDDLLLSGQVEYGWFGITTSRKLNKANSFDVVIDGFVDDSPAKMSKLKTGDIIISIGGVSIHTQGDLANASFFSEPDTIIEFKIKRDGKEIIVPLKVTIRPKNQKTSGPHISTNIEDSNSSSVADQNATDVIVSPNF